MSGPRLVRLSISVVLSFLALACQSSSAPPEAPADYVETIPGTEVQFDMVWIPEGRFWIGRTEVTWDEYLLYCNFDGEDLSGVDAISRPSKPLETFPYDREWGKGRRPAVGMSWNAAQKYCQWLSLNTSREYRLPSEEEWGLACGEAPQGPLDQYAWYEDNSGYTTHETASKGPNQYGLFDMLGNLWEYCNEPYDEGEPQWAVLRGGSHADPASDATPESRLQFDEFWNLDDPNVPPGVWWVPDGDHVGFRVLHQAPPSR